MPVTGIAVLLLAVILLPASGRTFAGTRPAAADMEALTAAWRDSLAAWAGETEEVRRERAAQFFAGITVADITRLCSTADDDTLGQAGSAGSFLEGRMRIAPLSFADMMVLLNEDDLHPSCQKTLIKHLSLMKENMTHAEKETAAEVLLKIADSAGQSVVVRNQLELAAAELSVSDVVLGRMLAYMDSPGDDLQLQGFSMMIQSGDPRADDLLFERLRLLQQEGELPPSRVLINLGAVKGRRAYDILAGFYGIASDDTHVQGVVHGMAHTGDPRFMAVLLDLYDDRDSGIRDATSRIQDPEERSRHFTLWHLARLMEAALVAALNGDNRELSRQALELIDRQSRFGIPAHPSEMAEALRMARERARGDEAMLERLDQIGARFEVHERARFERGQ